MHLPTLTDPAAAVATTLVILALMPAHSAAYSMRSGVCGVTPNALVEVEGIRAMGPKIAPEYSITFQHANFYEDEKLSVLSIRHQFGLHESSDHHASAFPTSSIKETLSADATTTAVDATAVLEKTPGAEAAESSATASTTSTATSAVEAASTPVPPRWETAAAPRYPATWDGRIRINVVVHGIVAEGALQPPAPIRGLLLYAETWNGTRVGAWQLGKEIGRWVTMEEVAALAAGPNTTVVENGAAQTNPAEASNGDGSVSPAAGAGPLPPPERARRRARWMSQFFKNGDHPHHHGHPHMAPDQLDFPRNSFRVMTSCSRSAPNATLSHNSAVDKPQVWTFPWTVELPGWKEVGDSVSGGNTKRQMDGDLTDEMLKAVGFPRDTVFTFRGIVVTVNGFHAFESQTVWVDASNW
ncbi:hypothetical protein HDU96_000385 [Phlyctochytrium bullatum]|nr:hypothetical protein HDU96_000385 [Phlyctochytrium bullatum]